MPTTMERLQSLVEGLYIATNEGRIKWTKDENLDGYYCDVNFNRVEIVSEPTQRGESDIRITVYNSSGDAVDSFTDTFFGNEKPRFISVAHYYTAMSTMLDSAKRSSSGADKVLDDIIEALGGPKVGDDDIPF
ncbi:hypothetical protein [Novosphingobium olei]|uniref:hypothetical protein n=1 Tax=Novosphingobium olei TaxID=2728851 RepID=UPI00308801E1|nr:hypothetical protein NSDW_01570 [Novosphingobium olei]